MGGGGLVPPTGLISGQKSKNAVKMADSLHPLSGQLSTLGKTKKRQKSGLVSKLWKSIKLSKTVSKK